MIVEIFAILIVILGFTLSIAVFSSGRKILFISSLSYLVLIISINFLNLLLIQFNIISPLFNFFGLYAILYGILLRQYRFQLENKNLPHTKTDTFHIILIVLVVSYAVYQLLLGAKIRLYGYDDLETIPGIILMSVSSIKGIVKFYTNRKAYKLVFILFCCFCLLSLLVTIEFFVDYTKADNLVFIIIPLIFLFTYILINTLIIHGLRFTKSSVFSTPLKYATSNLKNQEILKIAQKIDSYLRSETPFLKPNYTLDQLSLDLGITKSNISQALNEHFKKSFFELINKLRIEEAIKMMKEDTNQQISIKEIMYDSGFSSKSTFIKHFKKNTGYLPSEFRELNKKGFE